MKNRTKQNAFALPTTEINECAENQRGIPLSYARIIPLLEQHCKENFEYPEPHCCPCCGSPATVITCKILTLDAVRILCPQCGIETSPVFIGGASAYPTTNHKAKTLAGAIREAVRTWNRTYQGRRCAI